MNLDYEQAKAICFQLLEQVKKHNGEAVLLWHNTKPTRQKAENGNYQPRLYLGMLDWLRKNALL